MATTTTTSTTTTTTSTITTTTIPGDRVVYSTDDDLQEIRPNIMKYNVLTWMSQHIEAFRLINISLDSEWYRGVAAEHDIDWRVTPFDPNLVDLTQVIKLSCYKVLELAYAYLMKDISDDPFLAQSKYFRDRYNEELKNLLSSGVNYDWDKSGTIEVEEKITPKVRRLVRA